MQLHKKYLIIAAAAVTLAGTSGAQAAEKNYTLGSLAEGTTPFLVNTAFANAVNRHVPGHRIQVSAVGPATKHMLLVTRRKMDFTMAASTAYRLMFYEIGPFKKIKDGEGDEYKVRATAASKEAAEFFSKTVEKNPK